MEALKDYSGPFVSDIKYENFSKEVLARLLRAYCQELLAIDAYWNQQVRTRFGDELANECLLDNWCRIGKHEMKWTMEALNIQGNDVEAYVKANQFVPSFAQGIFDFDWDLKNKNHAVLTVRHCPALASLEKKAPGRVQWTCQVLEHEAMKAYVAVVNPEIQVKGLKVPPRESYGEIACQWEFKIE